MNSGFNCYETLTAYHQQSVHALDKYKLILFFTVHISVILVVKKM